MNWLYTLMERVKPLFMKGGKLERLYPLYEMPATILFVEPKETTRGAHIRDSVDMKRWMITVVAALVPCTLFGIFNIGLQHFRSMGITDPAMSQMFLKGMAVFAPKFITVFAVGGIWEVIFSIVRKEDVNEGFLVTGFLIPLIIPPTIPLWVLVVATSFGIVIGKEVFGGTGMNIFNPAVVTRAFIFFGYAKTVSGEKPWTAVGERVVDTYTQATPLLVKAADAPTIIDGLAAQGYTWLTMFLGTIPGSVGETSTLLILFMAIVLILTGVGSWRIMLSVLIGGAVTATLLNLLSPSAGHIMALPFHYHLVMGSFAFGMVFMATDPVSAAATGKGKWIYGFCIGVLIIIVRVFSPGYKEGTLLAIMFMNAFAPLIDHYIVRGNIRRRMSYAKK